MAEHRHEQPEEPPGGVAGGPVVVGAELAADGERGLGEPVADDLPAGGLEGGGPPLRVGLGPPADGGGVRAELAGGLLPRRAAGAQLGRLPERVIGRRGSGGEHGG